jgi:hypothetical protein
METITAFHFLSGFTIVVMLFGLFYGPWQTLVIATTRQSIFELRDTWFDATTPDEQLRNNEAVKRFRASLNSTLELLDMLTWMPLLACILFSRRNKTSPQMHPTKGLPHGEVLKLAIQIHHCSALFVLGHALARSIVFFPLGIGLLARARAHSMTICNVPHRARRPQSGIRRIVIREVERAALTLSDSRYRPTIRTRRAAAV